MRFDRGFFGLPIFIFPPFNPGDRRDHNDFYFDERYNRRHDHDHYGHNDNHGHGSMPYR
jgi:hypothetical protein